MQAKWFFVIWGLVFTGFIIAGIYFISSGISTQLYKQFKMDQNTTNTRFDNTTLTHQFLFDNVTDLKKSLDPIISEIGNATQMRIDEEKHNEQTMIHFKELNVMNQTINKILEALNNTNKTIITPVPVIINNGSAVSVNNLTTAE